MHGHLLFLISPQSWSQIIWVAVSSSGQSVHVLERRACVLKWAVCQTILMFLSPYQGPCMRRVQQQLLQHYVGGNSTAYDVADIDSAWSLLSVIR